MSSRYRSENYSSKEECEKNIDFNAENNLLPDSKI